jgi:hypothetical protein
MKMTKLLLKPLPALFFISFCLLFFSCQKELEDTLVHESPTTPGISKSFIDYNIKKGEQYCDKNGFKQVKITTMKFTVKFDSTAIYTTIDPANQGDINKLYGFSDNKSQHHEFSARFGWRWYKNALNLMAYYYNNSVVEWKDLGNVEIGKEHACAINIFADHYDFVLNGKTTQAPRKSTGAAAEGYQLYPFFGGTENAPHDIKILIRDDN